MATLTQNKMKRLAVCRIAGHILTIVLHMGVLVVSSQKLKEKLPRHRELDIHVIMGPRYLTIWNVVLQIFYAFYATICDLALIFNVEFLIPSPIRQFRNTLFTVMVFPIAWGIFLSFWPVYFYDRTLIFPLSADLLMTKFDNLIAHGYIVINTVFEVIFLPQNEVKHSAKNVPIIVIFHIIYLIQILYGRFVDIGLWPYDMLTVSEANILNSFLQVFPLSCNIAGYYLHFKIRDFMWGSGDQSAKLSIN